MNSETSAALRPLVVTPAQALRVEATLTHDGTLTLDHLPFRAGEAVEVLVLRHAAPPQDRYPLRGTRVDYREPTEPVADQEWDAAQ